MENEWVSFCHGFLPNTHVINLQMATSGWHLKAHSCSYSWRWFGRIKDLAVAGVSGSAPPSHERRVEAKEFWWMFPTWDSLFGLYIYQSCMILVSIYAVSYHYVIISYIRNIHQKLISFCVESIAKLLNLLGYEVLAIIHLFQLFSI